MRALRLAFIDQKGIQLDMRNTLRNKTLVSCIAFSLLTLGLAASADQDSKQSERALRSAEVLQEMSKIEETDIPQDLLKKAKAVAVIPHVVKGAFIVGGKHGKGLVSRRLDDGSWSAPAFVELSGGSFGLQVGVSATDFVLVFTGHKGIQALLDGKVKLGADASVAAGPVGRTAEASTDVTLDSEIYAYSRAKGVFAGIALDGAALTMDDSSNQKAYGQDLTGKAILNQGKAPINSTVKPFIDALQSLAGR